MLHNSGLPVLLCSEVYPVYQHQPFEPNQNGQSKACNVMAIMIALASWGLCLAFDEVQQRLSTEYVVLTCKRVQDWLIGVQFAVVAHISRYEITV